MKRTWANQSMKYEARELARQVLESIEKKDAAKAKEQLQKAMAVWARLGQRNVVHRCAASRKIARLSRAVGRLSASSSR